MCKSIFLSVLLLASAASAWTVFLYDSLPAPDSGGLPARYVGAPPHWPGLRDFRAETGLKVGFFPSVADLDAMRWTRADDGVPAALLRLDEQAQYFKSPRQKALENQYFAAAEALAVEAGNPVPGEADAKDLSKVVAAVGKARKAKDDAAGSGKKADSDALLKLRDLQLELVFIDAELKEFDPAWRKSAKKHVLE